MFHSKFSSFIHRFRDNKVFLPTENDVINIYPLGALCTVLNDGIWKGVNGFLFVFNSNFISIMHRFLDNDVHLQTGNDVIVLSPLGGAVRSSRWRILIGWPQVHIHPPLTYFTYIFNRLRVIRPFHFGWDFPTAGEICVVFWENDPQKVKVPKNTCLKGTSLCQTASLELLCVEIGSRVLAVGVARKEKK